MKKVIEEFKKFITRGNVMDLAVGVIVGTAFTGIVNSLVNNIKKVNNSMSVVIKNKDGKVKTGVFATGDRVIISDGENIITYEVLIYGDVTGDGVIDKLDFLAVQRHYYKYKEYNGVYKEAADADKNGVIDKLDFLAVLKDYYGYKAIEQ